MTDLEALFQYLRQGDTDYAYMLTGPWGSGKSYFWNNVVVSAIADDKYWRHENRPIPIYISLYGIRDVDDIPRLLLLQTHPKLAKVGKAASVVGRGVLEFFRLKGIADKTDVEEWLMPFAENKRLVICFDDLERSTLELQEVLGRINQYVEHLGMKTVILCNEDEILNRDDAGEYRRTKEKVVRVTRNFRGDPEEAINAIIQEFAERKDFHSYLIEHLEQVKSLFEKSELRNLRILKYGLNVLEVAYRGYKDLGLQKERMAHLPLTLLPVTFEFQRGSLTRDEATEVLIDGNKLLYARLFADDMKEGGSSPIDRFSGKYNLALLSHQLLTSPTLGKLVVEGHLDCETLKSEVDASNVQRSPEYASAIKFMEKWYILSSEEFQKCVNMTIKGLSSGEIRDWEHLIGIMRSVGHCKENGILPLPISAFKKAFASGLQLQKDNGQFLQIDEWKARDVGRHPSDATELAGWARQQLIAVNSQLASAQQKETILRAFTALGTDPEAFALLMTTSRGHGFGDKPIAGFIKADDFASQLEKVAPNVRYEICYAIRDRYIENHNVKAITSDLQWLKNVRRKISKRVSGAAGKTPERLWINRIRQQIDAAMARLAEVTAAASKVTPAAPR